MQAKIPKSKLQRGLAGGKTAARVGGKMLKFLAKQPFMDKARREQEKDRTLNESAEIVFKGLCLLKGTALKIAQALSMEMDVFPEHVRRELEKSYNQVPPMNRVLIKKAVGNAFDEPVEEVFKTFDPVAFAAASLGQVHRATSSSGEKLAVKVQYPGIAETIRSDVSLIKSLLYPLREYELVRPVIDEIEMRLLEEIEYENEAANIRFFRENLRMDAVRIPEVCRPASNRQVLSATLFEGLPLNLWLKRNPAREEVNRVAQILNDIFIESLYNLNTIHADPNPGNFIICPDGRLGLVDFGCVKKFDPVFVNLYRQLPRSATAGQTDRHFELLRQLKVVRADIDAETRDRMYVTMYRMGRWIGRLFEVEEFDFRANPDFFIEGKKMTLELHRLRRHIDMNANFVFLDRTRYGLLRLFETMGATVRFQNSYEWP
jgi:predicted unusual protein kinase regulating ubiquinone biosynthesis (AarF/ABC1/UbiB family)